MAALYNDKMSLYTRKQYTSGTPILIVILLYFSVVVQGYSGCPQTLAAWHQMETNLSCQGNTNAHCLRDDSMEMLKTCLIKSWIQSGFCPQYNAPARMIDMVPCDIHMGKCPDKVYWSNQVYLYSACLMVEKTTVVMESTTLPSVRYSRSSTESQHTDMSSGNTPIIIIVVVGAIVSIITSVAVTVVCKKKRKRGDRASTNQEELQVVNNETREPFLARYSVSGERKYISRDGKASESKIPPQCQCAICTKNHKSKSASIKIIGRREIKSVLKIMLYLDKPSAVAVVTSDNLLKLQTVRDHFIHTKQNVLQIENVNQWRYKFSSEFRYMVLNCFNSKTDFSKLNLSEWKENIDEIHNFIKDKGIDLSVLVPIPKSFYQDQKSQILGNFLLKSGKVFEL